MSSAISPTPSPLALYVHWPFCVSKCPYCDFNSHVRESVNQAAWQKALLADLAHEAAMLPGRRLTSIFFGGGTPSLMPPATVAAILNAAERHWGFAEGIEITLEANPSSVEAARFADLAAAGVNRASLGVQALDDEALHFLGRAHGVDEALRALQTAQEQFGRVSFDLIYARPGQPLEDWEAELTRAIGYGTEHLSLYQLTIEEGTIFHALHKAGKLVVPDGELSAELYEATQQLTLFHGLPAYEISNHAAPGAESRHNLTYWRYGLYAGVGPGAHARLPGEDGGRHAVSNEKHPETWLKMVEDWDSGEVENEALASSEQADELMLMGLRLVEGIDLKRWRELSGRDIDPDVEAELTLHGMIERLGPDRLRATPAGMLVLDAVVADLA